MLKSFGVRHGASEPVGDGWDVSCATLVLFLVLALAVKAMAVGVDVGLQQWRKKNSVVATGEKAIGITLSRVRDA
jgi:hypothetical protein